MNNLKKVGLTALAGSLVAGSVSAADLSVTGSATMSYGGGDSKATTGNGWTMADSVTFSASGDVNDIGVTLSLELDGDAADGTNQLDSQSIKFDLGDAGTLTFAGHGGDGAMSAKDDVMPTAHEEPWDILSGAEANLVGGHSGNDMFTYSYSHDSGVTLTAAYINASAAVSDVSYSDFGIEYTGMEGLTIGYAQGDVEATTNTKSDENTMYAKYAMGGITVGIQVSEADFETGTDYESTSMGISYQVNDDLSVSYGAQDMEAVGSSNPDQETSAVSVSYTMGSLSIAASVHNGDSIGNTAGNDREAYNLSLGFAF
jgi:outer membrane protein OmpU